MLNSVRVAKYTTVTSIRFTACEFYLIYLILMVVASFERAIHQNRMDGWIDGKKIGYEFENAIKPFDLLLYNAYIKQY